MARPATPFAKGKPLVREVVAREEIYGGKFLAELPDLYFLPSDPTQAVFGDFEFSSNKLVEPASAAISAQHRMDGVFIAAGPGIRAWLIASASCPFRSALRCAPCRSVRWEAP